MIAVTDSGPLMALAKVEGIELLFHSFDRIVAPPSVLAETVTAGQRLGSPDALLLAACFEEARIEVLAPASATLPLPAKLGPGEDESIRLAIELQADWLLMDDLDARRAAERNLSTAGAATRIQGTLGVIMSAHQNGLLTRDGALDLLRTLEERPDVWLSRKLILHLISSLEA